MNDGPAGASNVAAAGDSLAPLDPLDPRDARALEHWLRAKQASARQPSLSAALARGGEIVWAAAVGSADGEPDGAAADAGTAYRIGSITKVFVAVCVLRLVQDNRIGLDDPVGDLLGDVPFARATVAQLLCHGSGLQAETEGMWWERSAGRTWEQLVADGLAMRMRPHRRYHYSNTGYAVLGRVLEVVHGRAWDAVVHDEIVEPLGLKATGRLAPAGAATGWGVHPHADLRHHEPVQDYRAMGPAGEMWSTPSDLVTFGSFLAGRHPQGERVLGSDLLEQMREPLVVSDLPGMPWTGAHGLGLQLVNLAGRRLYGHTGSVPGFTADLKVDAETGDVVSVLGSSTLGHGGGLELLDAYLERCPAPVQSWTSDVTQRDRVDVTGTWYWGVSPFTISATRDGGLNVVMDAGTRGTPMVADGADRWLGTKGYFADEPLRAVRDASGRVTWLDLASFRLTRTPYDPAGDIPGGVDGSGWR